MVILKKSMFIVALMTLYLKFVFQMVLESHSLFLDLFLYLSLFVSLVSNKVDVKLLIISIFAAISLVNPAAKNFFLILGITYASQNFSLKTLACLNIGFCVSVFILTCFFLWGGVTKPEMFMQTTMDLRERWDFGYGNPNTFALFIYSFVANMYIIMCQKKCSFIILMILFICISVPVYEYTKSRSYLFASIVLLLGHLFFIQDWIVSLFMRIRMFFLLLPIAFLFAILFIAQNVSEYPILNSLLTGRPALYAALINSLSLKDYLFGTHLITEGETIDNAYLHILFEGGVLAFGVFYYVYFRCIKNVKYETRYAIPLLMSFLCYGITESVFTAVLLTGNIVIWFLMYRQSFPSKSVV